MLIWRHNCFVMASLIVQWTFKIVKFLNKGLHVFVFTKLPSSRFIFDLLLLHFDLLISSDFLIFLLLYLVYLDNVFRCSQLNWPWHFKQRSVPPELSPFLFMFSCWCSIVLVMTSFFVSLPFSALQLQFNAYNPCKN